jgi:hypothetical protein
MPRSSALKMEAADSPKTLVPTYEATRRNISEDRDTDKYCREKGPAIYRDFQRDAESPI